MFPNINVQSLVAFYDRISRSYTDMSYLLYKRKKLTEWNIHDETNAGSYHNTCNILQKKIVRYVM